MNKFLTLVKIISLSTMATLVFGIPAFAQENTGTGLTVSRLVICESVVDREPVGVTDSFSASTQKAYAFLEARDIAEPTEVNFVWSFEGSEKASVSLSLGKSGRWRTHSSKNLAGLKGAWKVELQDLNGNVLSTAKFTVQ